MNIYKILSEKKAKPQTETVASKQNTDGIDDGSKTLYEQSSLKINFQLESLRSPTIKNQNPINRALIWRAH